LPVAIHIPQPEFNHPAELAMIARLRDHGPALIEAYLAKETKHGVTFIARDAAKRLFPEYKQDPSGTTATPIVQPHRWLMRCVAPS
jgi:hypothetical protein